MPGYDFCQNKEIFIAPYLGFGLIERILSAIDSMTRGNFQFSELFTRDDQVRIGAAA